MHARPAGGREDSLKFIFGGKFLSDRAGYNPRPDYAM